MKKTQLNKLLIVGMAVSALLLSTACSRKSGQQPVQTNQGGAPAPAPAPGNPTSELDDGSGKSAQDSAEQDAPVVDDDKEIDQEGEEPYIDTPTGPQEKPQNSGAIDEEAPVIVRYDPSGMTPDQVFEESDRNGQVEVGEASDVGEREDGLRYTGAGQDTLREQLIRHERSKEKSRRDRDQKFARTINQALVDVDWSTRQVQIAVLMNGRRTQMNFHGTLSSDLIVRSGSVKRGPRIAVEAACMDLHGGCETVYLKIQDGNHGRVRTAHVISRTTTATLFSKGNGYQVAKNYEYDYFLNLLLNTVGHSGAVNTVNSLWMRTTEVIGGVSNYIVQMGLLTSRSGQTNLNWTGALVKPANSAALNAPAEMLPSTSPIANTIRDSRLLKNDGRGNIQLAVTIRKATVQAQEDTLTLTFSRIHKPTLPLRVK